jgi:hypothetical protein
MEEKSAGDKVGEWRGAKWRHVMKMECSEVEWKEHGRNGGKEREMA